LELACLNVLWKIGEGNVKDVRMVLSEDRNLAYTTVMTLLDRLVRRGSAVRRKSGRSFVYTATVEKDLLRAAAVRELVDAMFDGSCQDLLAYLEGKPRFDSENSEAQSLTRSTDKNGALDAALL
jgi:predicted transcriptional regulator